MERDAFNRSLVETVTWCVPRVRTDEPQWCLRSPELAPAEALEDADDPTFWNDERIVDAVVLKRSALSGPLSPEPLATGRLLLCRFDRTNHNYGSAEMSRFFFDGNDNPPWDCWVGVVGTALVAWVPEQLVALAEAGIAVECTKTLSWLTPSSDGPSWLREIGREYLGRSSR